jgi:ubiquitin carboxyl-terminal hydrolase 36/42
MQKIDVSESIALDGKQFELASVVIHAGSSAEYGHYYTVAKGANGQWLILNDSDVTVLTHPI